MIEPGIVLRHEPAIRHLTVSSVRRLSPSFVRITLGGDGLTGFTSAGPTDHCTVFLRDRLTGAVITRDYTVRALRPAVDGSPQLELDVFLRGGSGPGATWAARAQAGDPVIVAGPRGSRMPTGMSKIVLAADEAALPALARWIELVPDEVQIVALVSIANESDAAYLDPAHVNRARLTWLGKGAGSLERTLRACGPIADDTVVWAAGEASALGGIRQYLRRELALPAVQVVMDGYWSDAAVLPAVGPDVPAA